MYIFNYVYYFSFYLFWIYYNLIKYNYIFIIITFICLFYISIWNILSLFYLIFINSFLLTFIFIIYFFIFLLTNFNTILIYWYILYNYFSCHYLSPKSIFILYAPKHKPEMLCMNKYRIQQAHGPIKTSEKSPEVTKHASTCLYDLRQLLRSLWKCSQCLSGRLVNLLMFVGVNLSFSCQNYTRPTTHAALNTRSDPSEPLWDQISEPLNPFRDAVRLADSV